MRAISIKKFNNGFELTEEEFLRLIEKMREQLSKVVGSDKIVEKYEIILQNGTIIEELTYDEVIEQENHGSSLIRHLSINFYIPKQEEEDKKEYQIEVEFTNKDFYKGTRPMYYKVIGETRDWVFLTSSIIQERIDKIKRKTYFINDISSSYFNIFLGYILLTFMLVFLTGTLNQRPYKWDFPEEEKEDTTYLHKDFLLDTNLAKLEPTDFLIEIEKYKSEKKQFLDSIKSDYSKRNDIWYETEMKKYNSNLWNRTPNTYKFLILLFFPSILFHFSFKLFKSNYPLYNFIWGDYEKVFETKESKLKYFITVILIGVLISFIGGILANMFKIF